MSVCQHGSARLPEESWAEAVQAWQQLPSAHMSAITKDRLKGCEHFLDTDDVHRKFLQFCKPFLGITGMDMWALGWAGHGPAASNWIHPGYRTAHLVVD